MLIIQSVLIRVSFHVLDNFSFWLNRAPQARSCAIGMWTVLRQTGVCLLFRKVVIWTRASRPQHRLRCQSATRLSCIISVCSFVVHIANHFRMEKFFFCLFANFSLCFIGELLANRRSKNIHERASVRTISFCHNHKFVGSARMLNFLCHTRVRARSMTHHFRDRRKREYSISFRNP